MGRRRRKKVVKVVIRTLPKVFVCPYCGQRSVRVMMKTGEGVADVRCSLCGLNRTLPAAPGNEPVDIYCKFSDMFYTKTAT